MPPINVQLADAAIRAQNRQQPLSSNSENDSPQPQVYFGIPTTPTPLERLRNSPTTTEQLTSNPGPLDNWHPPMSLPQAWPVIGPQLPAVANPSQTPAVPEVEGSSLPPVTRTVFERDLFERNTPSGGNTQPFRTDYAFNPSTNRLEPQHESNSSAPGDNTIRIFGGTSDEFRYNNSSSQAPDTKRNINVGDTVWQAGGGLIDFGPGYHNEVSAGDERLGASADVTAGLQANANASYGFDGDTANAAISGEVFYGLEANAEAHVSAGPASASLEAKARAGASAGGTAEVVFDPRNGFSAELGAEAFIGAEVTLEANAGLGDSAEATAGVDLKAGIGFEANADVDFSVDDIGVDLELGAALGLGADFKVDLSISPSGIVDDAGDLASGAAGFVGGLFGR